MNTFLWLATLLAEEIFVMWFYAAHHLLDRIRPDCLHCIHMGVQEQVLAFWWHTSTPMVVLARCSHVNRGKY